MSSVTFHTAESGSDYNAIADPTILTLERGQDVACSTIEIFNDTLVEADEVFNVTLTAIHSTFYAGVDIIGRTATIEIRDNNCESKVCLAMLLHYSIIRYSE